MGIKSKILYWSPKILVVLFGVFLVIFGGIDDSPGAQLIGLILVVTGIITVIKRKKRAE